VLGDARVGSFVEILEAELPHGREIAEEGVAVSGRLLRDVDCRAHVRGRHWRNRGVLEVDLDLALAEQDVGSIDGTAGRENAPRAGVQLCMVYMVPRIVDKAGEIAIG